MYIKNEKKKTKRSAHPTKMIAFKLNLLEITLTLNVPLKEVIRSGTRLLSNIRF